MQRRWLGVVWWGVVVSLAACERAPRCEDVVVVDGCKARCKEVKPSGEICTELLQITRTGENNILQSKNKKVSTRKVSPMACFAVADGRIQDGGVQQQLEAQCSEAGAP